MNYRNEAESHDSETRSFKSVICICVGLILLYLVCIFLIYPELVGAQLLAHPLNFLYFTGLVPGLAIALALIVLMHTTSADELIWAKGLLTVPLFVSLPILGMDSSRCIEWGGIDCAFIVIMLVISCIAIPLLVGYGFDRSKAYRRIMTLFLIITYFMAAYIIFLATIYGGNNLVRAYSDMLFGTMF